MQLCPVPLEKLKALCQERELQLSSCCIPALTMHVGRDGGKKVRLEPQEYEEENIGLGLLPIAYISGVGNPSYPSREEVGREMAKILRDVFIPGEIKADKISELLDQKEWPAYARSPPLLWPEYQPPQSSQTSNQLGKYIMGWVVWDTANYQISVYCELMTV